MKEEFAYRLKKAMELRNIKASELSEKAQIPKSAISQYLSGLYEAKQKSIFKLAKILNVSEGWLMGLDVPMEKDLNSQKSDDFRMASYDGIDTEGLDEQDIKEINAFIEFIKQKKKDNDK